MIPLRSQNARNALEDGVARKRLLDEFRPLLEGLLAKQRIPRIAGEIDHLELASQGEALSRELASANARHDQVGDEKVDVALSRDEQIQSLGPICRGDHVISGGNQYPLQRLSYHRFVLDDEDRA